MKALAAGLAVALVALGMLGGALWRELGIERARNREVTTRMQAADAPSPGPVAAALPAVAPAAGATPDVATEPAGAGAVAQPSRSLMESAREMLATPGGQEYQRTMTRRMLAQQYPDIAAAMGLSAAQVEALFEVMARHQAAAAAESLQLVGQPGDPAAQQELFRRVDAANRASERDIAELLGPKYEQWQQYKRTASDRQRDEMLKRQTQQLRATVSSERNPLSDAQFESLSAALKAEERRIDAESSGQSMQQQLDGVAERTKRMAAVAADHLNAEQLAQYEAHLQQQAATMRAMMGMMGGE